MTDLYEQMAPLRAEQPTAEEIAAVLATPRRRRTPRLAAALVAATAGAAVAIAALPGARQEDPVALLRAAAAVAGDQPPAFTGYRYTEVLQRLRYEGPLGPPRASERRVENWVDRSWKGRVVAHRGRVLEGRPDDFMLEPYDGDYAYGDGPLLNVEIAELPTESRALKAALEANYRGQNWAPGHPTEDQLRYDITREVLLLLGTANTTPALRSALWGVLALMPGLQSAPDVRDPLGRDGEAVTLPARMGLVPARVGPARTGAFTVIFDPESSELLSWSLVGTGGGTPDQTQTFIRAGHVRELGQRP